MGYAVVVPHPDYPTGTLGVTHPERDRGSRQLQHRRITYGITSLLLGALVVSALVDGVTDVDLWGVADDEAAASGGGYELVVEYPSVSRPALATPFAFVVRRDGGFDGPIDVAIDSDWLGMWDFQALWPEPSEMTATPQDVVMTFDPPDGDVLRVSLDARIQPSEQSGRDGRVAVLDDGGDVAVEVSFRTRVNP